MQDIGQDTEEEALQSDVESLGDSLTDFLSKLDDIVRHSDEVARNITVQYSALAKNRMYETTKFTIETNATLAEKCLLFQKETHLALLSKLNTLYTQIPQDFDRSDIDDLFKETSEEFSRAEMRLQCCVNGVNELLGYDRHNALDVLKEYNESFNHSLDSQIQAFAAQIDEIRQRLHNSLEDESCSSTYSDTTSEESNRHDHIAIDDSVVGD